MKARKGNKKAARKNLKGKAKYACYDCGTEVIMDCCGVGFRELICCGKVMKKSIQ